MVPVETQRKLVLFCEPSSAFDVDVDVWDVIDVEDDEDCGTSSEHGVLSCGVCDEILCSCQGAEDHGVSCGDDLRRKLEALK